MAIMYMYKGKSKPHRWDDSDEWFKKYDHKLWASLESQAAEAGHGGMDFIMMYDLIDAIRNKNRLQMDCYDAAAWALSPACQRCQSLVAVLW